VTESSRISIDKCVAYKHSLNTMACGRCHKQELYAWTVLRLLWQEIEFPVLKLPCHWILRVWLENLVCTACTCVCVCTAISIVVCKKVRFQGTENLYCSLLDYDVMW